MTKTFISITVLAVVIGLAVSVQSGAQESEVVPAKISKDEFAGKIFDRPDTEKETNGGNTTLSATSFTNSDENFSTGVWRTGKLQFEQTEPWGVDEFLYIIDGSLTVTSSDGTVQVISAGEAITIPKEWTGRWDTEGFTQIWAIYSEDGSGLP
jgi:uncharacterized cupin superfamily protein